VAAGEFVRIFKRTLTTAPIPDDGHRCLRVLAEVDCSPDGVKQQIRALNTDCCDKPMDDCSSGAITTCDTGCAALVIPLWEMCGDQLGAFADSIRAAATVCRGPAAGPHQVGQFMVTCPAGTVAANCVPRCERATNGDLLLLNLNGDDSKLTCELHQSLYSWVGSAADGGYYGADPNTFFAAVSSGAA
jgi:hypothetical protein